MQIIVSIFNNKVIIFAVWLSLVTAENDFYSQRDNFIKHEDSQALGSNVKLTPDEEKVTQILMNIKLKEYDEAFENPKTFLPSVHFFHGRDQIEESKVFKFIQKIPKGASLHLHNTAMASFETVYNLTYSENLYACSVNNRLKLHFFDKPDDACSWKLVSELRNTDPKFDSYLKSQISLIVDNPRETYDDLNKVWSIFTDTFTTVSSMIKYKPIYIDYFYKSLQELHDDNVMYVEVRCTLSAVYDFYKDYSPLQVVRFLKNATEDFMRDHPRFIGVKLIYSPVRHINHKSMVEYLKIAKDLIEEFPEFVVGFDLVGQEDLGYPLISFLKQLREVKNDIKFFFHAGETNWYGTSSDQNLIDAVLLGTQRIGHGYALVKHPELLKLIKTEDIAIEMNPICNQVLLLVEDLRNHPGAILMSQGFPIVIGNDAPAFWGSKGLSYDWYMAYMGMASRTADLKFLKQLALNSLKYSALDDFDKVDAIEKWTEDWNDFIQNMLKDAYFFELEDDVCRLVT